MPVCLHSWHINTVSMSWAEGCERRQEYCWMPLFTGDWSLTAQPGTAGTLAPRTTTDYMSPAPHTTATILRTSLSEGYCSRLLWFELPLASFTGWLVDEKKHEITIPANHTAKSDRCARYWACNDDLVPPEWRDQETHLLKSGKSVELRSASASPLWGFSQSLPGASQDFPHWTQRGCEGAKQGFPAEATMTLERGVGPNGQPRSPSQTGFTSAILFLW